jgi:hypothetical protein
VTVRARVLAASAATLDRRLRPTRASVSGQRVRRRAVPAVQKNVPVRTFAEWEEPLPGDVEADLVSHGGDSAAGSFVHTLTLTDVASGWTECVALVVRDGALVAAALEQLRQTMPFPLRGFDTDNGGEFMNETVAAYCHSHGLPCTLASKIRLGAKVRKTYHAPETPYARRDLHCGRWMTVAPYAWHKTGGHSSGHSDGLMTSNGRLCLHRSLEIR